MVVNGDDDDDDDNNFGTMICADDNDDDDSDGEDNMGTMCIQSTMKLGTNTLKAGTNET